MIDFIPEYSKILFQNIFIGSAPVVNRDLEKIVVLGHLWHFMISFSQIRRWQVVLAMIGFVRIYIEKLRHLRCLAFVKVDKRFSDVCRSEAINCCQKLGLDFNQVEDPALIMTIPQDFSTKKVFENELKAKSKPVTKDQAVFSNEIFEEFGELQIDA